LAERYSRHPAYLVHVLGPTLLFGAGLSQMILPTTVSVTADLPPHEAGLASGLVNVARQIGGAIGVAALVAAASAATGHRSGAAGVVHGYRVALIIDTAVAGLVAVVALFLPAVGRSSSRNSGIGSPGVPTVRQAPAVQGRPAAAAELRQ
jgi:hypothetical protein